MPTCCTRPPPICLPPHLLFEAWQHCLDCLQPASHLKLTIGAAARSTTHLQQRCWESQANRDNINQPAAAAHCIVQAGSAGTGRRPNKQQHPRASVWGCRYCSSPRLFFAACAGSGGRACRCWSASGRRVWTGPAAAAAAAESPNLLRVACGPQAVGIDQRDLIKVLAGDRSRNEARQAASKHKGAQAGRSGLLQHAARAAGHGGNNRVGLEAAEKAHGSKDLLPPSQHSRRRQPHECIDRLPHCCLHLRRYPRRFLPVTE